MNSFEIKSLMKKLGITQVDIAKNLGIPKQNVYRVIHGERSTRRIRQAIADALGVSFEELWGDENKGNQVFWVPEEYKEKVKKIGLPSLYELATASEKLTNNRSIRTLYRDAEKGKLNVMIIPGRKKRRFFVMVEDQKEKFSLDLKIKRCYLFLNKIKSKIIKIRVPREISGAVDSISDFDGPAYKRFFNFIEKQPKELIKKEFDFYFEETEVGDYVERRLRVRKEDLEKLLDIAKRNNMNLSKVMEILLRGFLSTTFGKIPEEETIKIKGGEVHYGNMLLTD